MENGMQIFEREEFGRVRVVMNNGEPWFIARDVCECLELTNTSQTLSYLDDDEKGIITNDTPGGAQEMSIISESGLYSLILRSRKPEAKAFKRWVTHDILPSIRKTGSYNLAMPQTYAEALRALAAEVELREAVEQQKALAEAQRDHAIRTKAEIGNRREATAMATASAAVRQRDALADKLGEGKHWKSVKAIDWLTEIFAPSSGMYSVVGKKLAQLGERMGKPSRIIEDAAYGTVKAHHVDVIAAFRLALMQDAAMMGRYRRA